MKESLRSLCFSGRLSEAVGLLSTEKSPVHPSTYCLLLQESIHRKSFRLGSRVHSHIVATGHSPSPFLRAKLLIFYSKLNRLPPAAAHDLFDETSLVSWNALLSSSHDPHHALRLFRSMRAHVRPDRYTFSSLLRACARLAALEHGRHAHALLLKAYSESGNVVVTTALVDMYFKCSSIPDAVRVFVSCSERNAVTWTALISGYGQHGCALEVLDVFRRMVRSGFRPNSVTFLAVLSACSHGGLVDAGLKSFRSMRNVYRIEPKGEHYAAVVDMLGRAGRLQEAREFIRGSPCEKHPVVWGALLGACRIHRDGEMGRLAAERLFEMRPGNVGKYVVLSNTYASLGMWEKVADVRETVGALGMSKEPAWSSVAVRGEAHTFLVGDKSHGESEMIYETLRALEQTILC
ncbi:pentatricopeptide repeat-containing protein [Iris pallida]|uniref:Pentatricopeptide repeat-containing protein n=1 Tax=Iris pallida TaxID=29817 RepID=A0AAX6FZP6_IRIPA|nr:pentatricopeptide repeat-containing protein [Iris pallida]